MKTYSTRKMIDYFQTRGKENVIRFRTCLYLVKAFVNVFDRALEMSNLLVCKARHCKFMRWMVLGVGVVQ